MPARHIEETYRRPLSDRLLRSVLAFVLPYPNRFRLALLAAKIGSPFRPLVAQLPRVGNRLAAMLDLAPALLPNRTINDRPGTFLADNRAREASALLQGEVAPARAGRVALLRGCAQSVLRPDFNEAAVRLLTRHGVEVVQAKGGGVLRRAHPPYGQVRDLPRPGQAHHRCLDRRDGRRRPRRDHRHGLGLRHDDQGLRLHVPRRPGLCGQGGAGLGPRQGRHRIRRQPRA